ncbi:MAG: endonuclease/exonuclease/phosphatase family protein [Aquabacterium sp.]|nr:endonuclease/exonuclease/phosphatase family protein [Aquabacterium sp.]
MPHDARWRPLRTIALLGWGLMLAALGAAAATGAPFTAATWNLRLDVASDGANAWPQRRSAVKALIRKHGFDLFGTQEALAHQVRELETLDEYARVGVGRDDGAEAGEFAAIFFRRTRFSLLAHGDFWLSPTPERPSMGWDARCCKRIATWARLRDATSGRELVVFSAHFDHEGVVARLESARLMLRQIEAIAGSTPVICLGDFNATPETAPIRLLAATLLDAREASATPPTGPVGTFNGFRFDAPMTERIDYLFVSPQFKVLTYGVPDDSTDRRYPSDHHPVVVRLRLD